MRISCINACMSAVYDWGENSLEVSRVDLTKTKPELWGYAKAYDNQYLCTMQRPMQQLTNCI